MPKTRRTEEFYLKKYGYTREEAKQFLKNVLESTGCTIQSIANQMGVQHSTIMNYLAKHATPTQNFLETFRRTAVRLNKERLDYEIEELAEYVSHMIDAAGTTMDEVCKVAGIDPRSMFKYLNCEMKPSKQTLEYLRDGVLKLQKRKKVK